MADVQSFNLLNGVVTIGAVALGWVLGESSGWLKAKKKSKDLKSALFTELEDILPWLRRNRLTLRRNIQLAIKKQLCDSNATIVPTHIYDTHFVEILPNLTNSERISYNSIYNLIKQAAQQIRELEKIRFECKTDKSKFSDYYEKIEAAYSNTSIAIWQIDYHLNKGPLIDINRFTGDDSRRIIKEIEKNILEICREAKTLSIEEIKEKSYND